MISAILSTAIKLYLRSQVQQAQKLEVKILGKNRQILQGYIPQVWLKCDRAIYQGLHLQCVELTGTNIGFNLPEVLKKQPFKLLEPIMVEVNLQLSSEELSNSLVSPLLQSGLNDLWTMIIAAQTAQINPAFKIEWENLTIADRQLKLRGTYQDAGEQINQIHLSTGITLANSHTLNLSPIKIIADNLLTKELKDLLTIDLGKDVTIQQLAIVSDKILCSGKIAVNI